MSDEGGCIHTNHASIDACLISFYANLWNYASNFSISKSVTTFLNDLNTLNEKDRNLLIMLVTLN